MLNLGWDLNKDKTIIEIIDNNTGKVLMHFSLCEVLDSSDPEFIMRHLEEIQTCPGRVGDWQKYYSKKTLEKLES
jgi:hypothetical protein